MNGLPPGLPPDPPAEPPVKASVNPLRPLVNGQASKFIVAAATAVSTWLTTSYGTAKWEPVVITGVGALLVYLVPNQAPKSGS